MLKYKADLRTVLYLLVTAGMFAWLWTQGFNWPLYIGFLFLSVAVAVIAHNHNHLPIWKNSFLNTLTDYWITVFYGFPVFAWIPTHNHNHHKYTNKPGDYTVTYRYTAANNLITLLTYPTISGLHQQKPIRQYLRKLYAEDRKQFWYCISQYLVVGVWVLAFLLLDWQKALLYVVIPQQVSLFSVLVFNYVQHVHADHESPFNHSRNITGWVLNTFLFNNGYHTVHHLRPGTHWSRTPELHKQYADRIDPRLNEPSFWWFIIRAYILGLVVPSLRTRNLNPEAVAQARVAGLA